MLHAGNATNKLLQDCKTLFRPIGGRAVEPLHMGQFWTILSTLKPDLTWTEIQVAVQEALTLSNAPQHGWLDPADYLRLLLHVLRQLQLVSDTEVPMAVTELDQIYAAVGGRVDELRALLLLRAPGGCPFSADHVDMLLKSLGFTGSDIITPEQWYWMVAALQLE